MSSMTFSKHVYMWRSIWGLELKLLTVVCVTTQPSGCGMKTLFPGLWLTSIQKKSYIDGDQILKVLKPWVKYPFTRADWHYK